MNKRSFILAVLFLAVLLVAPLAVSNVYADTADWYDNRHGVLDSERAITDPETGWDEGLGVLYPYEKDVSLDVGFSKYGELIDPYTEKGLRLRQGDTVLRDMFVRNPADIPPEIWLNGWLIEIKYKTALKTPGDRFVWAFALFADGSVWGGDWVTVPGDGGGVTVPGVTEEAVSGLGGRQTNTYCETENIKFLYDGPRRSIAELVTHVYDANVDPDTGAIISKWALVDVKLTLIFNKDKKYVIILKDIKYKFPFKPWPPLDVKFSNREQVDLGAPEARYGSYAHFWHQAFSTCYGGDWLDAKWILKEWDDEGYIIFSEGPASPERYYIDLAKLHPDLPLGPEGLKGSEKVYAIVDPMGPRLCWPGVDYEYIDLFDANPRGEEAFFSGIRFLKTPLTDWARLECKYKVKWLKEEVTMPDPFGDQSAWVGTPESHYYDLAQFISSDKKFVGFKAYWPTTSSYMLEGFNEAFKTIHYPTFGEWCRELDMSTEPAIPFSIGQWDFMLNFEEEPQFRAVEVVGMVQYHDADDAAARNLNGDADLYENQVDSEVYWQLQEVFNPWDLNDAVSKQTRRLVEYFVGGDYDGNEILDDTFQLQHMIWIDRRWRDEDDNPYDIGDGIRGSDAGIAPDIDPADKYGAYENWYRYCTFAEKVLVNGVLQIPGKDYDITAPDTIKFTKPPAAGALIKVLYSTPGGVAPFSDTSLLPPGAWRANYEWIIVGRDSAPVDSAGAAMVAEMFKNKQIPVLWSGLDMKDTAMGPNVPYVMLKQHTGDFTDDYKKESEDGVPCHGRTTLKDDWCRTVPVKSSDMITVGGPGANLFTRYWNDFTNAYWEGIPPNDANRWIRSLTCWSKNTYASGLGDTIGYAVISTYKDIDGTVGFIVWGITGEDTYWASWWLWHFGYLLQMAPDCITDIVLKFDYTKLTVEPPESGPWYSAKYKPGCCFWSIVETLGTISEYDFTDFKLIGVGTKGFSGTTQTLSFLNDFTETYMGGLTPPSLYLDWRANPFWGVLEGSEIVKVGNVPTGAGAWDPDTATIDFDAATITVTSTSPFYYVFVKCDYKLPPLHPDP